MDSTKQLARRAGLLYFLSALVAPIGLMYVPGKLFVAGDAAATANNIRSSEWLLRLGIGSELVGQVLAIFVVLALYRLFKPVSEHLALKLLVLGCLVSVPIMFVNVLNAVAASILVSGASFLSAFTPAQLETLTYLFMRLHSQGQVVASIFWGLWLFPFGLLIIRSGFIPKLLGYLLMMAGVGYLLSSSTILLLPQYKAIVTQVAMILYFGELPIIFWLLIWGAREKRREM
jgi:hypothetical protein